MRTARFRIRGLGHEVVILGLPNEMLSVSSEASYRSSRSRPAASVRHLDLRSMSVSSLSADVVA